MVCVEKKDMKGKAGEFCEKLYENIVNSILLRKGLDIYIPSQNKEIKSGIDSLFQNGKRKVMLIQYKKVNKYR